MRVGVEMGVGVKGGGGQGGIISCGHAGAVVIALCLYQQCRVASHIGKVKCRPNELPSSMPRMGCGHLRWEALGLHGCRGCGDALW